jgi:hypothetical protein
MLKDLLIRKPGNEAVVLSASAKDGISAIDTLCTERNTYAQLSQEQAVVIDRVTQENEALREALTSMEQQRDFWMRANAKLEAHLTQLASIMQSMYNEVHRKPNGAPKDNVKQIAERFSPEAKHHAKSVG